VAPVGRDIWSKGGLNELPLMELLRNSARRTRLRTATGSMLRHQLIVHPAPPPLVGSGTEKKKKNLVGTLGVVR
jgi:hypothetical protein